jgi:hypothetical protein
MQLALWHSMAPPQVAPFAFFTTHWLAPLQ